ncbi:hypothetical protein [Apibacter adventoris]|uniref:hypothetical protein n=1 Tax=Apibacter adventoris TaxID=1679466 RepID=UPI0015E38468|nr:hypothetical protein [Apibacter adventoris]
MKVGGKVVGGVVGNGGKTLKPLGLGSTGRKVAKDLNEQLAMKEAMSNPSAGKVIMKE